MCHGKNFKNNRVFDTHTIQYLKVEMIKKKRPDVL